MATAKKSTGTGKEAAKPVVAKPGANATGNDADNQAGGGVSAGAASLEGVQGKPSDLAVLSQGGPTGGSLQAAPGEGSAGSLSSPGVNSADSVAGQEQQTGSAPAGSAAPGAGDGAAQSALSAGQAGEGTAGDQTIPGIESLLSASLAQSSDSAPSGRSVPGVIAFAAAQPAPGAPGQPDADDEDEHFDTQLGGESFTQAETVIFGLEVSAYRDGYRRAGRAWRREPEFLVEDDLTQEQLQQLLDDPQIKVRGAHRAVPAETLGEA